MTHKTIISDYHDQEGLAEFRYRRLLEMRPELRFRWRWLTRLMLWIRWRRAPMAHVMGWDFEHWLWRWYHFEVRTEELERRARGPRERP